MRNTFLQSFAKSPVAEGLIEKVLLPDLEEIKDVTKGEYDATKGEIFMGKIIAAEMIQKIIDDIEYYKTSKPKIKNAKNSMN